MHARNEFPAQDQTHVTPRRAKTALTATGGFLTGFTHTLNTYIGCRFGCDYCYVKGSPIHRFHKPRLAWGEYAHPRIGIDERLERELVRIDAKGKLDELAIFMSSATDPYQGLERRYRLTRACLEVMLRYPPGLLIVQTRSPLVQEDYALLRKLGDRCWLNMTLETDLESVRKVVTPRCPSIAQRQAALRAALDMGLNVQITASPCLPYSDVDAFGSLLIQHSHRVIVDTYASGDGSGGKRTAKTEIPDLYTQQGWGNWQAVDAARDLFAWLQQRIGDRAGWSQEGFTALTKQLRHDRCSHER